MVFDIARSTLIAFYSPRFEAGRLHTAMTAHYNNNATARIGAIWTSIEGDINLLRSTSRDCSIDDEIHASVVHG